MVSFAKRHSTAVAKTVLGQLVSCGALTENESEILTAAVEGGPESL